MTDTQLSALLAPAERYGVTAPQDRWTGSAPRYSSLSVGCAEAVQAEIDNGAIDEEAFKTTARAEIPSVYHPLREASSDRHLPAFRRCAERKGR